MVLAAAVQDLLSLGDCNVGLLPDLALQEVPVGALNFKVVNFRVFLPVRVFIVKVFDCRIFMVIMFNVVFVSQLTP